MHHPSGPGHPWPHWDRPTHHGWQHDRWYHNRYRWPRPRFRWSIWLPCPVYLPVPQPAPYYEYDTTAEVVIDHAYPEHVWAWLGIVGDPVPPYPVRFETSVPLIRSRFPMIWERYRTTGVAVVNLSPFVAWMDGSRQWYLRMQDTTARGGYLRRFVINTDAGSYDALASPVYFGPGRPIEVRLRPQAGYVAGATVPQSVPDPVLLPAPMPYPTPVPPSSPMPQNVPAPLPQPMPQPMPQPTPQPMPQPVPQTVPQYNPQPPAEPSPGPPPPVVTGPPTVPAPQAAAAGAGVVTRRLVSRAAVGQRVTVEYQVNPPDSGSHRVQITEVLPPAWRVVRAEPMPYALDPLRPQIVWDLSAVSGPQRVVMELEVPSASGWQLFLGQFRFDTSKPALVDGDERLWVGDGAPSTAAPRT